MAAKAEPAKRKEPDTWTSVGEPEKKLPHTASPEAVAVQAGPTATEAAAVKAGLTATEAEGAVQAGLAATNTGAGGPKKPSQADIEAGMAITVAQCMKSLIPYVQQQLAEFLRKGDSGFGGSLEESAPFVISKPMYGRSRSALAIRRAALTSSRS